MKIHEDLNQVYVRDTSEIGNEGHVYQIGWPEDTLLVKFQNGAVQENGVNGATNEAFLAMVIDRTIKLNEKFPCRENAIAITKMQEALMWFEKRTADRVSRMVEGKEKA